jgi:hypothetical protein
LTFAPAIPLNHRRSQIGNAELLSDPGARPRQRPAGGQRLIQKDHAATVNALPRDMTVAGPKREWPRIKGGWCGLPGGVLAGSPPHPKGAQDKGAQEHGNADEQQVQQALRDNAHDAQHYRRDHQQ